MIIITATKTRAMIMITIVITTCMYSMEANEHLISEKKGRRLCDGIKSYYTHPNGLGRISFRFD